MDSPFIRDPDHQFAHVIFYALMVNIYIYIYINTFSSPVEHSLTYLGRGRRKINENNERRGFFLMDFTRHCWQYTFRCGMHGRPPRHKIAACINWPCSQRDAYTGRPSAVATRDLTQIGESLSRPCLAKPASARLVSFEERTDRFWGGQFWKGIFKSCHIRARVYHPKLQSSLGEERIQRDTVFPRIDPIVV